MVSVVPSDFFPAVTAWIESEPKIESAVLFGSSARSREAAGADSWSDFDLHVVTPSPGEMERPNWTGALQEYSPCLHIARPATGGVRKVTAVFSVGQLDLVLVPAMQMQLARLALGCGLHRRLRFLGVALNEMATCLATGYRFLKGERNWGKFYARVATELPGVRLGDVEARALADVFLCELIWVLQKVERGELVAAQRALHCSLAETNFRLARELRLRRGQPVPSFGLGRRAESLFAPDELAGVCVDARLEADDLRKAAWTSLTGLRKFLHELVPDWQVPAAMEPLLARYDPTPGR